MHVTIHQRPAYAVAEVILPAGESVMAEPDAMVSMDAHVRLKTGRASQGGGFLKGILKSAAGALLGAESFFVNTFTAEGREGQVVLAPRLPGDVMNHRLHDEEILVQSGSWLACDPGVTYDTKWGGARSFFGGEGLFMLRVHGTGDVLMSSFGGITPIDVDGEFVVDTGHIVAFSSGLHYDVRRVGGWKSTLFSGEGLVCHFEGRGRIWVQGRNLPDFTTWLGKVLPVKQN